MSLHGSDRCRRGNSGRGHRRCVGRCSSTLSLSARLRWGLRRSSVLRGRSVGALLRRVHRWLHGTRMMRLLLCWMGRLRHAWLMSAVRKMFIAATKVGLILVLLLLLLLTVAMHR